MTAVTLRESARYGLRLYLSVLGVTILGGVGVGLGGALAWPEVQAWLGSGTPEPVVGVGGGVLLFLGISILAVGYFGLAFKLLADGVGAGSASGTSAASGTATAEPEPATADPNIGAEPEPEPVATDAAGTGGGASPETEAGSMAGEESRAEPSAADPPEPSPEEIVFGDSSSEAAGDDAEPQASSIDESPSDGGSTTVANQNTNADPLADPTDEE